MNKPHINLDWDKVTYMGPFAYPPRSFIQRWLDKIHQRNKNTAMVARLRKYATTLQ